MNNLFENVCSKRDVALYDFWIRKCAVSGNFRSVAETNYPDICLRSIATSYIRLELIVHFPKNPIRRLAFLEFMPLKSGNTFLGVYPAFGAGQ